MLTGQFPFPSYKTSPQDCLKHVSKGLLNYQLLTERGISQSAILLIQNMCDIDSRKRVSAAAALNNTWLAENNIYINTNEAEKESKIADDYFDKNT